MVKMSELLRKVHEKVHVKPNYSTPKIYTGGVDVRKWKRLSSEVKEAAISKPWYVYYSYRNPKTGYMDRQDNIKGGANYFTTKEERMEVLETYQRNLERLLKQGFNPFEAVNLDRILSMEEGLAFGLKIKKQTMSANSFSRYRPRIKNFEQFLIENGFSNRFITSVDKKVVMAYLNEVLEKTSPRNRNNTRTDLSSLFQVLEDNEIIPLNFIRKINVMKAPPVRNKTYSDKMVEDLFKYLDKNNPQLLLFIQFVSFNFLRPVEVCRLRVGDINLTERTLTVKAKNKPLKTKLIPQILIDKMPDLSGFDLSYFVFGAEGVPGQWNATEDNRRDNFTKQFKAVKKVFDLGEDYGIYSFRHWAITRLYRSLRKTKTPFEVKSEILLITGHSTMRALEMYLRDIDVEISADYSDHLKTSEDPN